MKQLVYTMFISNNRAPFICGKSKLWYNSKYYEDDCVQNFLLHHMSVLTANFVKKSHIYSRIYLIFLENVLKQT